MSDSLQCHESQHARPPCPSPTPRVHPNSCPLSRWCQPAISSSVVPFSFCPNPSQHQSLFQWINSSHEVTKVLEFQLQHQSFLMQKSSGSLNHLWEPAGDSTSLCVTHNSRVTGSWFLWFKWLSKSCGSLYILCILLIPLKTGELWSYLVIRLEWMSKWDVCHLQNPKETARCCAPVIVVENLKSFVIQSCPTLCDPMNCNLPGSSVHGIFQARVLELGAIAFSRTRYQIRSVAQSCPTLCYPMNRSTPGLPVCHQLPEFTQTHVHQVSDAIQPSHPLLSSCP